MIRNKTIFEMKVYKNFIITVIISVLMFGLLISKILYDAMYEKEIHLANKELDAISMKLDSLAEGIVKESLYLIVHQNYQKVISKEDDTDYNKFLNSISLSNILNSIAISQNDWESIVFYKGGDIYQSNYRQYSAEFWEKQKEVADEFAQSAQPFAWTTIAIEGDTNKESEAVVSYLRKVYSYSGVFQGILEINMPYSRLLSIIPEENLGHMEISFEDTNNQMIVATKEIKEIKTISESLRYIKLHRPNEKTGLTVWAYLDSNYISKNISVLFIPILLLVTVIISVASIFVSILSNKITSPITNIEKVVKLVSRGNRTVRIGEIPEGALGELSIQINEMIKNIDKLIEDNQKIEEQKRRLELNFIQLQINPHFLYNALETVCGMIEEEEKNDAIKMISYISNFYREILKRGESLIPLEEEICIAEHYIKVMQYRYPHLFSYKVDVVEQLRNIPVIKLILQPLVENCIEHGFVNKKGNNYMISLYVQEKNDICYIDITDNGIGFTKEKRDFINKQLKSNAIDKTTENFALNNINTRLQLQFGSVFGITILDHAYVDGFERGATIRICIPAGLYCTKLASLAVPEEEQQNGD